MGVEELTEGRLRAAGSMSGILEVFSRNGGWLHVNGFRELYGAI
jgi:hypothetical protein